jgi:hypothetical protein
MNRTLFEMLGIADQERIHTQMIAWLLTPNDSPLCKESRQKLYQTIFGVNAQDIENITPSTELKNLDLAMIIIRPNSEKPQLIAVLENKFKSSQSQDQLSKYNESIKEFKEYFEVLTGDQGFRKVFLSFSYENPDNNEWLKKDYIEILNTLNEIKCDNQYFIDYKCFLQKLVKYRDEFTKNHKEYSQIFKGSGQKEQNRILNPISSDSKDLEKFVSKNKLERLFVQILYRKITSGYNAIIEETRGRGLIQIYFYQIKFLNSDEWCMCGFQIQGSSKKINIRKKNYKGGSIDNNILKKLNNFFGKKDLSNNPPRSEDSSYVSWSRRKKGEFNIIEEDFNQCKDFVRREFKDARNNWEEAIKSIQEYIDQIEPLPYLFQDKICRFCGSEPATTSISILDTWKSPYSSISYPSCQECASKHQEWMT